MDSFEIDSNASLDSFHLSSEDLNIPSPYPHSSTPESPKNLQDFENGTEKLRLALENSQSEVDILKSSNNALKKKIEELFLEAQSSLEDKLKLQNTLKDRECQLAMIENSSKWYQARLHESEAANKSLKTNLEAYQKILQQREQTIADCMERSEHYQQLKVKFERLQIKYQTECENFQKELKAIKNENSSMNLSILKSQAFTENEITLDLRKRIDEMSRDLEIAEKRYLNSEMARSLEEKCTMSCKRHLEKMREELNSVEIKKTEALENLRVLKIQSEDLRIENERLNLILLSSKKEKVEVEEGIVHLRLQLTKMIAQHKALKTRNLEAEKKLRRCVERLRELEKENKRLKARNFAVNNFLARKFTEEKRKCQDLAGVVKDESDENTKSLINHQKGETVNSMTICLRQALTRERELRDRLKLLSKPLDESVDEGYADSAGFSEISSPSPLNSGLMDFAVNLLRRSQNFMLPINSSLNELERKLERLSATSESLSIKCR